MKHQFDQPIDIHAIEREARRLRAEAFSQAMRGLRDRLLRRRAPRLNAHTA
ncbi:RSP_7527 family protein [Palleronia sp. KMU-117]|uniref:RSP_7527 family protein n=1 Tax=Palleronia sp. KMU-117 TaxID=3434108 RepID=UPI003D72D68E